MKYSPVFKTPSRRILYLLLTTPLALLIGLLTDKILLPLAQAAAIFPLYYSLLSRGGWRKTAGTMIAWAFLLAILVSLTTYSHPSFMEQNILNAAAYRDEMFHWISTGFGPEGNIQLFLPQHILHFLIFAVLTLLSGGFLGLVMGSILMNYMSFYVGCLLLEAESFMAVLLLAWPPWAMIRVAGFILTAMALSMLLFRRFRPSVRERRQIGFCLLIGFAFLVMDVGLKWSLAGIWRDSLQRLTGL